MKPSPSTLIRLTKLSIAVAVLLLSACHAINDDPGDSELMADYRPGSEQSFAAAQPADFGKRKSIVVNDVPMPAPRPVLVMEDQASSLRVAPAEQSAAAAKHAGYGVHAKALIHPSAMLERRVLMAPPQTVDRENYAHQEENPVKLVSQHPVSTFSIDVDTSSYSNVRRFLNQGQLPPQDAVRVEELVNYFKYDYPAPEDRGTPFSVHTELAPAPWNPRSILLHVGLQGYSLPNEALPPANLVFLIDVSGSMHSPQKLGLLKQGFRLLTQQLRPQDTVSIAVYAGASGTSLEPTSGDQKAKILQAIDQLQAGGSTNGAAGIELAYQLAEANKKPGGINRVILATDGDFNVGTVDFEALKGMVERRRETGIALTTLGFGSGNYNDHLMEQLADAGNGSSAYIDNLQEARKVLVEEMGSTLQTIAKDVKIQIEFNPHLVQSYRLVGYENRVLRREDFNNDKVDAGDIGAGHSVTAIYELELTGSDNPKIDPLRYGKEQPAMRSDAIVSSNKVGDSLELAYLKLRYKLPDESSSRLLSQPIYASDIMKAASQASSNFRFAAAVAGFGQLLRGGHYTGDMGYEDVVALGLTAKGADVWGYRSEFINLVRLAKQVATQ